MRTTGCILLVLLAMTAWALHEPVRGGDTGDVWVDKEIAVLEATECDELFEVNLFVNGQRPDVPVDVMLVFDRSGSMRENGDGCTLPEYETQASCEANGGIWGPQPLVSAKEAAKLFIDQLGAGDRVGLVTYATDATLDRELTWQRRQTKLAIDDIEADGWTNLAGGVDTALEELRAKRRDNALPILIVMSDGVANRTNVPSCDNDSCGIYPCTPSCCSNEAIAFAAEAKAEGIYVFTIFLKNILQADAGCTLEDVEAYGEATMSTISSGQDFFYAPESPDELALVYDFIATQIPPAAVDLTVRDEISPEFEVVPGSIVPAPTTHAGNTLEWEIGILSDESRMFTYQLRRSEDSLPPAEYPTSNFAELEFESWTGEPGLLEFPATFAELQGELCGIGCEGQGRATLLGKNAAIIGEPMKFKLAGQPDARFKFWMDYGSGPILRPGFGIFCLDFSPNRVLIDGGRLSGNGFHSLWWTVPQNPDLVGERMSFQFLSEDPDAENGVAISNGLTYDVHAPGSTGDICEGGVIELETIGVIQNDKPYPLEMRIRAVDGDDDGNVLGDLTFDYDPSSPPELPLVTGDGGLRISSIDAYPGFVIVTTTVTGCGFDPGPLPNTTRLEITLGEAMSARDMDTSCTTPIGPGTRFAPFFVSRVLDAAEASCD